MPRRKKSDQPAEEVKTIKSPGVVKGMKDTLPSDHKYWRYMLDTSYQLAKDYQFTWIDTPIVEKYDLFAHALGKNSDFVRKEMFWFQDKADKVVLRPEHTPGVARSFLDHSLFNQTPPNKFWYSGKVYRQTRGSESKHRELHEVGFEVYNEKSPAVDAELIVMVYQTMLQVGLNPEVRVNSLGCLACRSEYAKALTGFVKSKRSAVCTECRTTTVKDPIKFLACLSQKCSKVLDEAPQTVDYLCEGCNTHLFKLLETLDELGVEYVLDARLIKDFAYYNSTVFSIFHKPGDPVATTEEDEEGEEGEAMESPEAVEGALMPEPQDNNKNKKKEKTLLAEGGRFNYLVEMLSGPETPAVGVKFFVEKVLSAIKASKLPIPKRRKPHVYLAQLSEQAKRKAMSFLNDLRKEDFRVVANFSKDSLKSQLDSASKLGAKIVLIIGQREVVDGTILMRDVDSGIQEVVNIDKVVDEIKKKIHGKKKGR